MPLDIIQYCLVLKGLSLCFVGDYNRRFCTWTEYNSLARRPIDFELEDQGGRYLNKRLEAYGSLGKREGQLDRYPYSYDRRRKVRIFVSIALHAYSTYHYCTQ